MSDFLLNCQHSTLRFHLGPVIYLISLDIDSILLLMWPKISLTFSFVTIFRLVVALLLDILKCTVGLNFVLLSLDF